MKVSRESVVAMFQELGWPTARRWNKKRMLGKLKEVVFTAGDDETVIEDNEELNGLLQKIVEAEGEVEIVDGPVEEEVEVEVKEEKPVKAKPVKEKVEKTEQEEVKGEKPVKAKPVKEKVEKTEPAKKSVKKTRLTCATLVLRGVGGKGPITEEMISKVDDLYGRPNSSESEWVLKMALQVITAYS